MNPLGPPRPAAGRSRRWRAIIAGTAAATACLAVCATPRPAMASGWQTAGSGSSAVGPATASGPAATGSGPATTASGPATAVSYQARTRVVGTPGKAVRLSSGQLSRLGAALGTAPATPGASMTPGASAVPGTPVVPGASTGAGAAAAEPTGNCGTPGTGASVTESEIETPLGPAATVPAPGGKFLRFYGSGDVALLASDGSTVWDREPHSFWGDLPVTVTPAQGRGEVCWTNPVIDFGQAAIAPSVGVSGTPYAVGTVAGEPDPVVAVAHVVAMGNLQGTVTPLPAERAAYDTSVVSLLDGRTGATLWSAQYPGVVMQLGFAGGRLLAADSAGPVLYGQWTTGAGGPAGTVSRLDAWAFATAATARGGALTGSRAWTYTMHSPWAMWLGLLPAGPGTVAVAWSDTPFGLPGQPGGHVLLLDDGSGKARWSVPTDGYPRSLGLDAVRDQVVVMEESDPALGVGYTLAGLRLADGGTAERVARTNAIPLSLRVGDLTTASAPDWAVTEIDYVPDPLDTAYLAPLVASATVFTPGKSAPAWQARVGSSLTPSGQLTSAPFYLGPWGLAITRTASGPELIVANELSANIVQSPAYPLVADDGAVAYSDLRALSGADGRLLWDRADGDEASAPYPVITSYHGQTAVASINDEQDLRFFSVASGTPLATAATFAGQMWTAVGVPPAADRPGELIVGGVSGGVFALDSSRLGSSQAGFSQPGSSRADGLGGDPRILWHVGLGGPVHQVALVRPGSGAPPVLVVAATTELAVLSLDGTVRYRVPFPSGQAVLSFTTGDIGPGGTAAIVVPTNALTAIGLASGRRLWRYQPAGDDAVLSDAFISAKGTVTAQYAAPPPVDAVGDPQGPPRDQTEFGVHGATGTLAWSAPFTVPQGTYSMPYLDNGVTGGPDIPGAGGNGVAFAWELASSYSAPGGSPLEFNWSQEQVDVRDADTGALAYSQQTPNGTLEYHNAYATGPGTGLADCDTGNLVAVGQAGLTPQGTSCADIAVARAGTGTGAGAGDDVVLTPIAALGQTPGLYAAPADYPSQGGALTPLPNPLNFGITGVVPVDLRGDGTDEAVGLGYDIAAQGDLTLGVLWSPGAIFSSPPQPFWFGEYGGDPEEPTGIEVSSLPSPG